MGNEQKKKKVKTEDMVKNLVWKDYFLIHRLKETHVQCSQSTEKY